MEPTSAANPTPASEAASPGSASWESCLERFRAACRSATPPTVPQLRDWLLLVCPEEQPDVLVDLVAEHLRCAWATGQGTRLEDYLAVFSDFPDFASPAGFMKPR